jgi:spore coat protein U-like protein
MKLTKTCLLLSAMTAMLIGLAGSAMAQSAPTSNNANLTVRTKIVNSCTISTAPVVFTDYNPLSTTPNDADGSVVITCTKGAVTPIGLNLGANNPGGTSSARRMTDGTNFLPYELYKDAGRAGGDIWGNSGAARFTPAAAPNTTARTFGVYGRIEAGQDQPAGDYVDTVVATVNF